MPRGKKINDRQDAHNNNHPTNLKSSQTINRCAAECNEKLRNLMDSKPYYDDLRFRDVADHIMNGDVAMYKEQVSDLMEKLDDFVRKTEYANNATTPELMSVVYAVIAPQEPSSIFGSFIKKQNSFKSRFWFEPITEPLDYIESDKCIGFAELPEIPYYNDLNIIGPDGRPIHPYQYEAFAIFNQKIDAVAKEVFTFTQSNNMTQPRAFCFMRCIQSKYEEILDEFRRSDNPINEAVFSLRQERNKQKINVLKDAVTYVVIHRVDIEKERRKFYQYLSKEYLLDRDIRRLDKSIQSVIAKMNDYYEVMTATGAYYIAQIFMSSFETLGESNSLFKSMKIFVDNLFYLREVAKFCSVMNMTTPNTVDEDLLFLCWVHEDLDGLEYTKYKASLAKTRSLLGGAAKRHMQSSLMISERIKKGFVTASNGYISAGWKKRICFDMLQMLAQMDICIKIMACLGSGMYRGSQDEEEAALEYLAYNAQLMQKNEYFW